MRKNTFKAAALALMVGTVLQLGGCFNRILMETGFQLFANILEPFISGIIPGGDGA